MTKKINWLKALYHHYNVPPETLFPRFKLGAVIFFLGLIIVYTAHQLLDPSLAQEVVLLIGLITIGTGFLLAILVHVRMLIGRVLRVFSKK